MEDTLMMYRWTPVALMAALACATALDPAMADPQVCPDETVIPDYDRSEYGRWRDEDKDCQDTRQEILVRDSTTPVVYEDERNCRVKSGTWIGPYTGETFTDPGTVEIDHIVPLEDAHFSGAGLWEKDKKRTFSNDLENLIVSGRSANRSKGSRDPAAWLPPYEGGRCDYLTKWRATKTKWALTADPAEEAVIIYMLHICEAGGVPPLPQN
jgi:hypothetical protein